jgi:hypothetical protein
MFFLTMDRPSTITVPMAHAVCVLLCKAEAVTVHISQFKAQNELLFQEFESPFPRGCSLTKQVEELHIVMHCCESNKWNLILQRESDA